MFFTRLLRTLSGNNAPKARRRSATSGFSFSGPYASLESRQMLATTITFNTDTGVVLVDGDSDANIVDVSDDGVEVVVAVTGGDTQTFDIETLFWIEFRGRGGDDVLNNNSFVDMFMYGHAGNDTLIGGGGYDFIQGGLGNDIISGGFGDDDLFGHDGDDTIDGGGDHDTILGGYGDDIINGDGGNDYIGGDWDDDIIHGGDGDDTLLGFSGNDYLYGDDGDDKTYGQGNVDRQWGGDGFDTVRGGPAVDFLYGEGGNDYIQGDQANDHLEGGDGSDVLIGFTGDDYLSGGAGDDFLYGQQDNDEIHGNDGEDKIKGDIGDDVIYGGADYDWIRGGTGTDVIYGEGGDDRIFGDDGDDTIVSGSGADVIFGDAGNDVLRGGDGYDEIEGGAGNDSIHGGVDANNLLTGDAGFDRFLTRTGDTVTDQSASDDARLIFVNETSNWNDVEIEVLDVAFQKLYDTTGNTRLLKDSLPSGDLTIYKFADLNGWAGLNSLSISYSGGVTTYVREIHLVDWDETSTWYNEQFQDVMIHEIGHNWDSELELTSVSSGLTGKWDEFKALSGWTDTDPNSSAYTLSLNGSWWYLNSASFAENYGRTNPNEDFATIWELYFSGDTTNDPSLQAKLDLMDDIFAVL